MTRRLLGFPDPVDEVSARLVAGGVVVLASAAIVTRHPVLLGALALGFLARVLTGPRLSPLGRLVTQVVRPRLAIAPRPVPGPPKRFAQAVGLAFSGTAFVLVLVGSGGAAAAVLAVLLLFAALEAVAGFCMGCLVFRQLMRAGVIPETVCERCDDIWGRRRA